jgi:hypothetical protein
MTFATSTAEPLLSPFVVTCAESAPTLVGATENVTVSDVALAAVTVPSAPLSNVTSLFASVLSKPNPAMVMVAALSARLAVLSVMTGITVAT